MGTHQEGDVPVRCRVRMGKDGTSECGRAVYRDEEVCICHSRDLKKDEVAFYNMWHAVLASTDLIDLSRFVFPDHIELDRTKFGRHTLFVGAMFVGEASFRNATFQAGSDFSEAEFRKDACFADAAFSNQPMRFISARFRGGADFGGARFGLGTANFEDARFSGAANFQSAVFDTADFSKARFESDSYLSHARFLGSADFASTTFLSAADFTGTYFERQVRFVGDGNNLVFASTATTSFLSSYFQAPQQVSFHHVFLGRAFLRGVDVRQVDFTDVEWAARSS